MNQIHPRYQHTLDDLFLQVFVLIDDFLQPFEPQLPSQATQKASISEILTIAIVGEILAQPFESVWYWLVTQNHQDLFPSLPHPSRYHRILRNSERLIAQLALSVTGEQQGVKLIDSNPCRSLRASALRGRNSPRPRRDSARWGWCLVSSCMPW